jgi:hypothetical protein
MLRERAYTYTHSSYDVNVSARICVDVQKFSRIVSSQVTEINSTRREGLNQDLLNSGSSGTVGIGLSGSEPSRA